MRILFVTHNVPRFAGDAAGSFVLRLAVALRSAGHDVEVIAPGAPGNVGTDAIEGVPIHRVRYARDARMTLAYTGTMAESVRGSWAARVALIGMLRALRRATQGHLTAAAAAGVPYDIIHAHWWFPAGLALWRLRKFGAPPLVITMHGSDVRLAQGVALAQRVMRSVLATASIRTAVSTWLADRAAAIAPAGRIYVEPMPVDTSRFMPATNAPLAEITKSLDDAAPPPRAGILFVGRLNRQKGLASLLTALALPPLADEILTVVGDGPDAAVLRAQARALGVHDRVQWTGALSQGNLAAHYQRAIVVAIPSIEEGLGLVAVEAQLCETPVVAFASGGILDVVRPEAGGTLVRAGDTASLAEALARLLNDPSLAGSKGQHARASIVAHFAPAAVAERFLTHYRNAVRA